MSDDRYTNRLRKTDYEVVPVSLSTAQEMVREHHYAKGGSNTAVYTHGLVHRESGNLVGVVWWLPPTRVAAESVNRDIASAEGAHSLAVAGGYLSRARGALGCWLVLAERDRYGTLLDVRAVRVDGETIKAGVSYTLRDGEIVEAE